MADNVKDEPTPVADNTPDTPPPSPPNPPVEPRQDDDLRSALHTLEEKVNGLISMVETNIAPNPTDETPIKLPWTHKPF